MRSIVDSDVINTKTGTTQGAKKIRAARTFLDGIKHKGCLALRYHSSIDWWELNEARCEGLTASEIDTITDALTRHLLESDI